MCFTQNHHLPLFHGIMASNKHWSDSEVQYLLDKVKDDPRVLKRTFEAVGKHIGRTSGACAAKYYLITKEATKENTCFSLVSKKYSSCNRKQFSEKMTKPTPKGLFTRIINAIFKK